MKYYILYCDYGVICKVLSHSYWYSDNINSVNAVKDAILRDTKNLKFCEIMEVFVKDRHTFCDKNFNIPLIAKKAIFKNNVWDNYTVCPE